MKRFKKIYIEITDNCNMRCSFCPGTGPRNRFMSIGEFTRTAHQAKEFTDEICLHLLGEPLLHPEFRAVTEAAAAAGLRVNLTTNGTLLHRLHHHGMDPVFSQINFSLHGLMDAGILDQHLGAIISFAKHRAAHNHGPYINLRFWLESGEGVSAATRTAAGTILNAFGLHAKHELDRIDPAGNHTYCKCAPGIYLHFNHRFSWPAPDAPPIQDSGYCLALKTHCGVLSDGTVVPCCLDWTGTMAIGNVFTEPLAAILSTEHAGRIRDSFNRGALPHALCRSCGFIQRFAAQ